ncbi:hypothetical protein ACLH1A_18135 [Enterobacter kobei]|uniref:tail fiber/spike domain-containing protein n=1 Tax=Enterobacter cloacae complex TaxID=354276 RepID=UPI0020B12C7A|nr:hypothetical protein [Enterobacter cloacae complex sp.]
MATQPTNFPVPSESPRDLKFNAGKIDEFVTSLVNTYVDRFGNEHYTIEGLRWMAQQAIAQFGWIPVESFQAGATLTLPNQILKDTASGEYYRWDGALPKVVPAGSTPATTGGTGVGAWVSVGDSALRSMLSNTSNAAYGDALVGVKQPFDGSVGRTQHDVNADMVINVKDSGGIGNGSASSVADIAAVQAAINAYAPMISPVHVKIPRGTWNLSGITIPRRGVVLDLTEATIEASSGVVFSRSFAQVAAADFKSANPPLDGNQTYFRPIVIKGGTVNLSGTATFLEIRQPYLAEYSIWGKTLIINDTQIKVYGSSKAFGIHGGWGFDLNTVSVTGDVTASTGYGSSVGSGTFLELHPDGTYYASSHPQLINMNNCNISYCKVLDGSKGSCTNSCEALVFNNSACMFVDGGDIQAVNLFQYYGGMFVTTAREMVCSGMAGTRINGVQMQRYNNPRTEQRRGGSFSFVGGGNDIVISDIRGQAGAGLNGAMVSFVAVSGEQFIDIDVSNFKQASGALTNINEPDTGLQTCAVRLITGGTGKITGITLDNITGINIHNIVDMGDSAAVQSMSRANVTRIRNITTTVKRRVRWTPENVGQLNAPELYKQVTVRMKGSANSAGTNVSCLTDPFFTGLTGTITGTRITTSGVSNSTGISLREMQDGGVAILDLYQTAGLSAGASVEASGLFRFSSADSILS